MSDLRVSFPKPCSEAWDAMRPDGCNRFCGQCEKIIHDLSQLTLEGAEQLARSGDEICVRAVVASDGIVSLKAGDSRNARRMLTAFGASVGILAASSQATAAEGPKLGAIKGAVLGSCGGGSVSATAVDGRVYHAKIGSNGRYKVKRLPAGSYEVKVETFVPESVPEFPNENPDQTVAQRPPVSEVVVEAGRSSVLNVPDPNGCIIVGMLKIEGTHSDG